MTYNYKTSFPPSYEAINKGRQLSNMEMSKLVKIKSPITNESTFRQKLPSKCTIAMSTILILLLGYLSVQTFLYDTWKIHFSKVDFDQLNGAVVIVTGASRGIGEKTSYQYAKHHVHLVIVARNRSGLLQVRQKCMELGAASAQIVALDLSLKNSAEILLSTIQSKYNGELDVLVLNHIAALNPRIFNKLNDVEIVEQAVDVNFISHVRIALTLKPLLEKSKIASMVVVGTLASWYDVPYIGSYVATKSALKVFFSSLRQEAMLSKSPLTISFVTFGAIYSDNFFLLTDPENIPPRSMVGEIDVAGHTVVKNSLMKEYEVIYPCFVRGMFYMLSPFPKFSRYFWRELGVHPQTPTKNQQQPKTEI